ncbi:hypothetical protein [Mariniflexile sp. AS56]|uniref:hypothetical protein n=1 Tax=Mariniflexile sp. AS56 TaxID=3063957 RepID=UPI0026F35F69|nr:hypothetical protein [Mariniflexile sp. AS56]MDO7170668.1 hypothetical protein [Mariniflexile sp. AS56]
MNKNLILYVFLVFLIVANGFFLFNYLGGPNRPSTGEGDRNPEVFIVKELGFNETQMQEFDKLSKAHHKAIRAVLGGTKGLKDDLFKQINIDVVSAEKVDSLVNLIGEQERQMEYLKFTHLRGIQQICNEKQKERFKAIVNDALRKGGMGGHQNGPPPPPRP